MEKDITKEIGSVEFFRANLQKTDDRAEGTNSVSNGTAQLTKGPCRDAATAVLQECSRNETCPICPHTDNCISKQFTAQQIDEHLRSLVAIARVYPQIEPALTATVQIIKQLQAGP